MLNFGGAFLSLIHWTLMENTSQALTLRFWQVATWHPWCWLHKINSFKTWAFVTTFPLYLFAGNSVQKNSHPFDIHFVKPLISCPCSKRPGFTWSRINHNLWQLWQIGSWLINLPPLTYSPSFHEGSRASLKGTSWVFIRPAPRPGSTFKQPCTSVWSDLSDQLTRLLVACCF